MKTLSRIVLTGSILLGAFAEIHAQPPIITKQPVLTSVSRSASGAVDLSVTGDTDLRYVFEASTNLVNWTRLGVRTNLTGIQLSDPSTANYTRRFYRVSVP